MVGFSLFFKGKKVPITHLTGLQLVCCRQYHQNMGKKVVNMNSATQAMVFNRTALSLDTGSCCVEGAVDLRDQQAGHPPLPCLTECLQALPPPMDAREAPEYCKCR